MKWFIEEESGQGMVEYVLVLALISIISVMAMQAFGNKSKLNFEAIVNVLSDAE